MNIYHLDSSVNDITKSLTRKYTKFIVDILKAKNHVANVKYVDLAKENIPFITKTYERAIFKEEKDRTDEEIKELETFDIESFINADVYVLGVPGYLFSAPARFKNWLEHLFVTDKTINKNWVGLLSAKKMYVVSAWGGSYTNTAIEHSFESIVKKAFNLFGINNITFFNIYRDVETETDNIKNIEKAIIESI